jgi:hypothetical protein
MRDYYSEFVENKSGNTEETELTKLTKLTKAQNTPFVSFVSEQTQANGINFNLDELLEKPELKAQFEFEVSERTSIMIFDGGLSETEAAERSLSYVVENWLSLFAEDIKGALPAKCASCGLELEHSADGLKPYCAMGCRQ